MKNNLTKKSAIVTTYPDIQQITSSISSEYSLSLRKMTHEINNALTLINSSLQIIESSHPEVKGFKYWDSTICDIHYLISLVSEISFFNNSNNISPEPTDVIALINNVVNSFKAYEGAKDMDISVKTLNHIPIIPSDQTKLKQVIINLIKNAYEAIEKKDFTSFIHIIIDYKNESITITVQDNGCGMTPEQMENIFTPLVSYKANGNGLGLPISKKIIESHSGTLTVDSTISKGTSFTITLPVKQEFLL